MMKNKIKLLPSDLINKIAAGEVVERPASILKELLENSIDAEADEITIELENSGIDSISVSDNGTGMSMEDAKMALLQHATSKISKLQDLDKIETLGFRGEALASIASISELTLHTYDGINIPLTIHSKDSKLTVKEGPARNRGTTIKAGRIFGNVPARRKFLKSENTEYKYIYETLINIVLTCPKIKFKLIKNGKQILDLKAVPTYLDRIIQTIPQLKESDCSIINYNNSGRVLEGYLVKPGINVGSTPRQFLFLNNRYIRNGLLLKAVKEGYATALMTHDNPNYFIYLQLPSSEFDVNVHPRKLEVRFENSGQIYSMVKKTVQFSIEKSTQDQLKSRLGELENIQKPHTSSLHPKLGKAAQGFMTFETAKTDVNSSLEFSRGLINQANRIKPVVSATNQKPAFPHIQPERDDRPSFMQIFDTYILTVNQDHLLVIDQHAAHERINFEKIKTTLEEKGSLQKQDLLIPDIIKLQEPDLVLLRENKALLNKIGFEYEIIADECRLNSIPLLIVKGDHLRIFNEIMTELADGESTDSSSWRKISDKMISTMACHSSIRAGKKMTSIEIENLLKEMFACKLPYSCPHGRPIIWEISQKEIEKKMRRTL